MFFERWEEREESECVATCTCVVAYLFLSEFLSQFNKTSLCKIQTKQSHVKALTDKLRVKPGLVDDIYPSDVTYRHHL